MAMTDFTIIRRSLTSRLFSTVITALMVATSVALLLVLLSMRDSGRRAFERGMGNMHMLVSRDASPLVAVLNGVFYANPPRTPIDWAKYEQLASSQPFQYAIPIQQGDSYRGYPVLATTHEFFTAFQPALDQQWGLASGDFLRKVEEDDAFEQPFEVVLGAAVARETGLSVDDEIYLTHGIGRSRSAASEDDASPHVHREYSYTVVGILETTGGPHDRALFTHLEAAWIIHANDRRRRQDADAPLATIDDLVPSDRLITGIYLRVISRQGSLMSGAQQQVFDALRRDTSITVADPNQQVTNLFRIVGNIDDILLAMAAVVLVSSSIAIMLALYNSMEQRRRQIAVLRVLGCSRGRVFGLVMTESAVLGILGSIAGVVLAWFGAQVVAEAMKARLGLVIEPSVSPVTIIIVMGGAIVLAAAAGVVPAVLAYRTSVVRNLRPLG